MAKRATHKKVKRHTAKRKQAKKHAKMKTHWKTAKKTAKKPVKKSAKKTKKSKIAWPKKSIDNRKVHWEAFKKLQKRCDKAWAKIRADVKRKVKPEILIRDRNHLLLLLGECDYMARECMRHELRKEKNDFLLGRIDR